jgi:hypothetical protein
VSRGRRARRTRVGALRTVPGTARAQGIASRAPWPRATPAELRSRARGMPAELQTAGRAGRRGHATHRGCIASMGPLCAGAAPRIGATPRQGHAAQAASGQAARRAGRARRGHEGGCVAPSTHHNKWRNTTVVRKEKMGAVPRRWTAKSMEAPGEHGPRR